MSIIEQLRLDHLAVLTLDMAKVIQNNLSHTTLKNNQTTFNIHFYWIKLGLKLVILETNKNNSMPN